MGRANAVSCGAIRQMASEQACQLAAPAMPAGTAGLACMSRRWCGANPARPKTEIRQAKRKRVMTASELYKKGEAVRRRLRGDADFERNKREYERDPVMQKFIEVATETVFGALWTRPGLDIKTRTLICVISDAATGRHPELDIHLRFALKEGWTEEELTEALLHLSGYVGVPIIREAMLVASKVFADVRAERSATG